MNFNWEIIPEFITSLETDEVFVFGSNVQGFHGLGAAAQAFFGTPFPSSSLRPRIAAGTVGIWAVWGTGEGHMVGTKGESYAIPTVDFAKRKNITKSSIKAAISRFYDFAAVNPHKTFLFTPIGTGLAGFNAKTIDTLIGEVIEEKSPLANVRFVKK